MKAVFALKTIGVIGDAVILAQNTSAAGGTSYYGSVEHSLLCKSESQVIWPCLSGNGIPITDDGMILLFGQNIDIT